MRLFIDTETTGLPRRRHASIADVDNWPRLVQVAWVLVGPPRQELEAVEHIIVPDGFSIPADAARIHGITTAHARAHGQPLTQVLVELASAIGKASTVVAHNVDYDRPVLGAEFLRAGQADPLSGVETLCTMQSTTDFCAIASHRGYKWPTLEELHRKLFGRAQSQAHTALADVRTCIKCYDELVARRIIPDA